ncbi:MAG: YicC family protein [Magnetococcales bacterium]|nr:YicC family protein [Magnetococcales bacterium]
MPRSMTGFARCERELGDSRIVWRIKAVNHRYLDLSMRMPDGCEELELLAVKRLKEQFHRGHLDCTFTGTVVGEVEKRFQIDETLLKAVLELEQRVLDHPSGMGRERMTLDRILTWPGVMQENRPALRLEPEQGYAEALDLLEQTIAEINGVRETEGRELVGVLRRHLEALQERVDAIVQRIPGVRMELESRLRARVVEFAGTVTHDERLAQELAYLFNRLDITEETDRLMVHIREMFGILEGNGPVGRRLDFLCQELNREGNTLCSKSQDKELSRLGVDIKVLVEQVREQAQNLE